MGGEAVDRARGALVGLAVGDAVGTTLEFKPPGSFEPITDLIGGGPFGLQAGQWTDDTSMALCLADSIVTTGGLDLADQLERYVRWRDQGLWSSNGRCFDIGNTTASQLRRFERTGLAVDPNPNQEQAANGSLMRLAPVPIAWHRSVADAAERSGTSSCTTHAASRPVDCCRLYGAMVAAVVGGAALDQVLGPGFWQWGELHPQVTAIAGQLAGAWWGLSGIPATWRSKLTMASEITQLADDLYALLGDADDDAGSPPPLPRDRRTDPHHPPLGGVAAVKYHWPVTNAELKAAHCWFGIDRVAGEPEVTAFKRRARWHQCQWRIAQGLAIGSHTWTVAGVTKAAPNGSKIAYDKADHSIGNFLSLDIVQVVRRRIDHPQPHQTFDEQRLWSDLLSSMPMCFNLFGEAAAHPDRLQAAVDVLWPMHPGAASGSTFEWSPGRRNGEFLNNATAFDATIHLDVGDGTEGVIGIETKYHEHIKAEAAPSEVDRMPRYRDVTEASGAFKPGWEQAIVGTDLQQIWLDHLLVLAMLQDPSHRWSWGRFVLVYPAANPSVRAAAERYRRVLADDSTFEARTIEDLLEPAVLHAVDTAKAFRDRYLWEPDERDQQPSPRPAARPPSTDPSS